jgi:hypothetical protein
MLQKTLNDEDAWFADSARMTIASIIGFMVSAQFVSLEALEIPYYVALLGAGSLVVHARTVQAAEAAFSYPAASATESVNYPFVAVPIDEAAVAFEPVPEIPQRRYMNSPVDEQPAEPVFSAPTAVVESVRIRDWRDTVGREVGAIMN